MLYRSDFGQEPESAVAPEIQQCLEQGGRYDDAQGLCMLPAQVRLGAAGWLLRGPDEPCNGFCRYDWLRAGVPGIITLASVYASASSGALWKGAVAGIGVFAAVSYALHRVERGPAQQG